MWNDKESDVDLLGHIGIARTISSLVHEPGLSPLTVGVYGDWGAGKSSILRLIQSELGNDKKVCCMFFNGWLFQGYEDTKSVLMQAIIADLQKQQPSDEKLKQKAKELLRRVDWLKFARHTTGLAVTALTGIPDLLSLAAVVERLRGIADSPSEALTPERLQSVARSIKGSLRGEEASTVPEEVLTFRKEFQELLKAAKVERLVVLVDDLDRCLPSTAIEILEAIRLFLYVPGTVFVLAADEQMVAYAVRKHFPDLPVSVGQADYTKNYLEKLIQVPFRIPPLGKMETRAYITLLLAEYALKDDAETVEKLRVLASTIFSRPWEGKRVDEDAIKVAIGAVPEKLKTPLLLADRISPVLAEGLRGNPRQVKRFLNTLMVRLRIAETYGISALIDMHLLAKLMLLERFDEQAYRSISELTARSDDGRVQELLGLETHARQNWSTKKKRKKGETQTGDFPPEWLADEWLQAWARIDPALGTVDLRPYVFISREKTPGFAREILLGAALESIAEKLGSGQALVLAGIREEVKALNASDARKLFDHLSDRARQASSWRSKPKEIDGLYELCKANSELQQKLVGLLEGLPVSELGAWAVAGMRPVLTEQGARSRFGQLVEKWTKQQENTVLQRAAEQLGSI